MIMRALGTRAFAPAALRREPGWCRVRRSAVMTWLRAATAAVCVAGTALAADTPLGVWKTVDEKTGKARSDVEIYEQDGKLFGRIQSIPDPDGPDGKDRKSTTSELQSLRHLVCRLLLEKKKP